MKNKVQDLIDAKEIEFEAPERPNIVIAPMPKHGVNAIEEDLFVVSMDDIVTPLDCKEEPFASRFISGL